MLVDCVECGNEIDVPEEAFENKESVIIQCGECGIYLEVEDDGSTAEVDDPNNFADEEEDGDDKDLENE